MMRKKKIGSSSIIGYRTGAGLKGEGGGVKSYRNGWTLCGCVGMRETEADRQTDSGQKQEQQQNHFSYC